MTAGLASGGLMPPGRGVSGLLVAVLLKRITGVLAAT
jgi:hypothetical protein